LEVPDALTGRGRHPRAGNPHIRQIRPHPLLAKPWPTASPELDPAKRGNLCDAAADFTMRWQAAMAKWQTQAAPLKGSAHRGSNIQS